MDSLLRILQRKAQSDDPILVRQYISALERALGLSHDDQSLPINMYLVRSFPTLPIVGVFSSPEKALQAANNAFLSEWQHAEDAPNPDEIDIRRHDSIIGDAGFPSVELIFRDLRFSDEDEDEDSEHYSSSTYYIDKLPLDHI